MLEPALYPQHPQGIVHSTGGHAGMITRGASGAPRWGVGVTDGLDVGATGCCETFAGALCLCGRTIIVERRDEEITGVVWFPLLIYAEASGRRFLAGCEAADDFLNNIFVVFGFLKNLICHCYQKVGLLLKK